MKHLHTFESDRKEMLSKMQGIGLSPKPLGFWISMAIYYEGSIQSVGYAIIAPNLKTVAKLLFTEFYVEEDYLENYENYNWQDITEIIEKINDSQDLWNHSQEFCWWEMTPLSLSIDLAELESTNTMNPVLAREFGNRYFRDFDEQMKKLPEGNQ